MRTLIGMGEEQDGVYYNKKEPRQIQVHAIKTRQLWH